MLMTNISHFYRSKYQNQWVCYVYILSRDNYYAKAIPKQK
jgi:hypothetical protein